jgi:hypothetical protein
MLPGSVPRPSFLICGMRPTSWRENSRSSIHFWMQLPGLDLFYFPLKSNDRKVIVSILNLVQMKLMKVICNMTNILNKEFQHFVKSQVIEMMKKRIHIIQFVSVLNLIQMQLMKVINIMKNMTNKGFQYFVESYRKVENFMQWLLSE